MLAIMTIRLLITVGDGWVGDSYGSHPAMLEILAENAIPRFGNNSGVISPFEVFECFSILENCIQTKITNPKIPENLPQVGFNLCWSSEVIRGSAYPEQTMKRIMQVQGKYEEWFKRKFNLGPLRVITIVNALVKHTEETFNTNQYKFAELSEKYSNIYKKIDKKIEKDEFETKFHSAFADEMSAELFGYFLEICKIIPSSLPIKLEDLPGVNLSQEEIEAFISNFCISKRDFDENKEIRRTPFYILNSGKILISDLSNCLDVIWDKFESLAQNDGFFYQNKYQKFKSNWLEKKGVEALTRLFPNDIIYQTLDYPDITKNTPSTTELDIALKVGPFLLLIEAKAKLFRYQSTRGDVGRLRTDLKKNIHDSYEQATRAIKYIYSTEHPKFIERNTGRILDFKREKIRAIFPISLSLMHLGGVATRLKATQEINLFAENEFPFSICLADLELISLSHISPIQFIHYIQKRINILTGNQEWLGDELDLFSAYTENKSVFDKNNHQDLICVSGMSEKFDRLMIQRRGQLIDKQDISLRLPENLSIFLTKLEQVNTDEAKLIYFEILELENENLLLFSKLISEFKNSKFPKLFKSSYIRTTRSVISLVCSKRAAKKIFSDFLINKVKDEKINNNCEKSIGIGILLDSKNEFHIQVISYKDGLISTEIENNVKYPKNSGRNRECPCGSGKKLKNCCFKKK